MNNEFFQRMDERDQREMPINQALKQKLARELGVVRTPSWFSRVMAVLRPSVRPVGGFALAAALVFAVSLGVNGRSDVTNTTGVRPPTLLTFGPVTDDWQYDGFDLDEEVKPSLLNKVQNMAGAVAGGSTFQRAASPSSLSVPAGLSAPMAATAPSMPMKAFESAADASLGFSVGGAKDVDNFRKNIKNNFLPQPTDVTYEGLFYDYSFDTGQREECKELFCPSYARSLVKHPLTGQEETYLSVGLNSNLKESDFKRPKTNFVVVLDISGSMGSPFDQYYYDAYGKRLEVSGPDAQKTKMQLANESLSVLVDHLKPEDRLGIVLFSDDAKVAKPLRLVGETDREALKRHIMELQPTNGTNMSAGLEKGFELFTTDHGEEPAKMLVNDGYVNRLIFITDAMPNQGEFGANGLHDLAESYVNRGVQTTFLGVGVDFQTELVEALTKVRGANYLSIHSAQDFKQRLGEEFDFLVSPLVYDLRLQVKGLGYAIDEIYGSPDADLSSGEVLHVRTLFPSKTTNGETKGGLVLLKLRKTGENPTITLQTSYADVHGKTSSNESVVSFQGMNQGTHDNNGIRKGVLLVQYGRLLKDWLKAERGLADLSLSSGHGGWERGSEPLRVSGTFHDLFQQFTEHFKSEARAIGDSDLSQEQAILDKLATTPTSDPMPQPKPVPMPYRTDDWNY